jgi:sugar/nucleoside kinase (ribokinase family)
MSILVVGSIALDTVETPFGVRESILGGSAVYFSLAASHFAPVALVGVVGEDFPAQYRDILRRRGVGLDGLAQVAGKTFRWSGCYRGQMSEAETRLTELNVFGEFKPVVPTECKQKPFLFLANCSPQTQLVARKQVTGTRLVLADTMNFWIQNERDALLELMDSIDGLILNEAEARQLSGEHSLLRAARWVCEHGPSFCIIKKAEHGAMLLSEEGVFALPAYPTDCVKDPTGAGDSFAGGLMGYIASCVELDHRTMCKALAYATVVASFTIEDFGPSRLCKITREDIERRMDEFLRCTQL